MSKRNAESSYNRGRRRQGNGYGGRGSFNNNRRKPKRWKDNKKKEEEHKKEIGIFLKVITDKK